DQHAWFDLSTYRRYLDTAGRAGNERNRGIFRQEFGKPGRTSNRLGDSHHGQLICKLRRAVVRGLKRNGRQKSSAYFPVLGSLPISMVAIGTNPYAWEYTPE